MSGVTSALAGSLNDGTTPPSGPTLVAHTGQGGTANSVTTSAIDTTGANLLVASAAWNAGAVDPGVITDSKGNTWTSLAEHGSGTGERNALYYCFGGTVGSGHTFTYSGAFQFPSMQVQAWSGMASSPFDVQNGNDVTAATSITIGSVTPSQANSVLITGIALDGEATAGNITINGGFTKSDTNAYSIGNFIGGAMAYKILTSSAATNPVWTTVTSNPSIAGGIAAFKY